MSDEVELRTAWTQAVGTGRQAEAALDSLLARHREPHRRYHGVRHVVWVLRHVHGLAAEVPITDLGAVVAAACFHDAIYDPQRSDNEEVSAALARRELGELGWLDDRCGCVAAMIRATAGHVADATTPDALADGAAVAGDSARADERGAPSALDVAVLLDADLGVLAADAAAYQAYVTGVRAEYAHVGDAEWRQGRASMLDRLLGRPSIYTTAPARQWWEARARANLAAELATLR
jgi:predicted metal-dependent HD superfamily phosphohydrolase